MDNLKIFQVCGEYRMSEDDNFKTAKNIAYDSATEKLDDEVEKFLRDNFKNLDDYDIVDITIKFLQKNEPRFVRENLPKNEMICYAYIDAQINLDDLNKFMENFDVFKLEKKIDKMQKNFDELNKKFELYKKTFPKIIDYTKKNNYFQRGLAYSDLKLYEQAISDFTQAIKSNKYHEKAYCGRGNCYFNLENYSEAIFDYTQAINLYPHYAAAYYNRGLVYRRIGNTEKAEKDFKQAKELGYNK